MDEQNTPINPIPSTEPPKTPSNPPLIALIILVVILLGATGLLAYQNMQLQKQITKSQVNTYNSPVPSGTDETANWKTYTNTKHGYSIKYPNDWSFREFSSTKDGAGFYNTASGDVIGNEPITINFNQRPSNDQSVPFSDYVKIAAIKEIQGFESLVLINLVTTNSGIVGYKTTWNYKTLAGEAKISLPITYFDTKLPTGETVQINLGDKNDEQIYNKILSTFKFTDQSQTDTSNWKTYTNQNYKFSFNYPALWTEQGPITSSDTALVYLHSNETFGNGPEPLRYFVWVAKENSLPNVTFSQGVIGSYKVYKTDKLPSRVGELSAFITDDGKTYVRLSLDPYDANQPFTSQDKYLSIFNQILSTFKFTQ